jgi:predicted PurR-regulated permease PerM
LDKKTRILVFLLILLAITLAFAYVIAKPFLKPVAFAAILAIAAFPLHERVQKRVKGSGWAAFVTTLLIILVFLVPLTVLLLKASNEAVGAAQRLSAKSASEGGFVPLIMSLINRPLEFFGRYIDLTNVNLEEQLTERLNSISVFLLRAGAVVLGNLAGFIGDALIAFVTLYFFLKDGRRILETFKSFSPLSELQTHKLLKGIGDSIVANVYGIVAVGAAQGILVGIAMRVAGISSAVLLGIAAAVCSLIPIVGPSLVWLPAAIYLFATGHIAAGVFVLIWCSVVVGFADNIIRPWVIAGRVEIHPLILLFALIGGATAFGFLGLFLGPIVVSVLMALFEIVPETLGDRSASL